MTATPPNHPIKHLLLDLDGTLTDPFEGISRSICHALEHLGVERPSDAALGGWIGPPLRQSFAHYLQTDDTALLAQAMDFYRERFARVGMYENRVYEGIPSLLEALQNASLKLYLATSKPHIYATKILQHFELADYFTAIHGSELDGTRADKTALIAYILATEGFSPESALMVGDRQYDIHGAKHNQLKAVGVAWGYGSPTELWEAGACQVLEHPSALQGYILARV